MGIVIDDPNLVEALRLRAASEGVALEELLRRLLNAGATEDARIDDETMARRRTAIRRAQEWYARSAKNGPVADKAFFDELSGS